MYNSFVQAVANFLHPCDPVNLFGPTTAYSRAVLDVESPKRVNVHTLVSFVAMSKIFQHRTATAPCILPTPSQPIITSTLASLQRFQATRAPDLGTQPNELTSRRLESSPCFLALPLKLRV